MAKSWKDLFIKSEEPDEKTTPTPSSGNFSFPVNNQSTANFSAPVNNAVNNPAVKEVIEVYEKGLDSINMPGYDFYEFYKTITAAGIVNGEQVYNMAFQMAKTLDNTVTPQKLLNDAEFYISKINEVHGQYSSQGQQKTYAIQNDKTAEKTKLSAAVDAASRRMMELQNELRSLELDIKSKQEELTKVDSKYFTQEQAIKEKMAANDLAHAESIAKLNRVKDGIKQFIKN
jgi:hypothetical protein